MFILPFAAGQDGANFIDSINSPVLQSRSSSRPDSSKEQDDKFEMINRQQKRICVHSSTKIWIHSRSCL